ncbi:NAD-P-binding protein [Trametes polyzona]|nr:NAD-P-binding protein [Trametes polyzona]
MPVISSGLVLITGANGFVAAWTIKAFLEKGFSVRGTVRSAAKAEYLRNLFSSYGEKLSFVVVPDMTQEGAFDQAVKEVDAIVHIASPVHLDADDPSEIIDPAVNGTLGILRSAAAQASVKRVVYLSSCAAVFTRNAPPGREYDESSWNDADVREVEEHGRDASALAKYSASKIFAERRAWAFYEENQGRVGWDLVVLNPPWVFGPVLHEVLGGPKGLNDSNKLLFLAITKGGFPVADHCYIDVRDLAQALISSATKAEASGQRIIVSGSKFKWEDFILAASNVNTKIKPPAGYDGSKAVYRALYDTTKSKRILGMSYRTLEETTTDVVKDWEARGWL